MKHLITAPPTSPPSIATSPSSSILIGSPSSSVKPSLATAVAHPIPAEYHRLSVKNRSSIYRSAIVSRAPPPLAHAAIYMDAGVLELEGPLQLARLRWAEAGTVATGETKREQREIVEDGAALCFLLSRGGGNGGSRHSGGLVVHGFVVLLDLINDELPTKYHLPLLLSLFLSLPPITPL